MLNCMFADRTVSAGPLGHVLDALKVGENYEFVVPEGLSSTVIYIPEREAIIALTLAQAPLFRAGVEASANRYVADVVLLRVGPAVDGEAAVTADIALAAPPCAAWVENNLTLWSDGEELWLVPAAFRPSIEISHDGFTVALIPPYQTLGERRAGIVHASRAIAHRLEPVEA